MAVTAEKRRGFGVEVGHNEQVSHFIHHTYLLFEVSLFFYSGTGFVYCLFVSKKEFALGNRGWCPRGLTFEKVLGIHVAQQCLLMAHIGKVYSVFHHSFFSDVCDYAQNKEANKGSVVLGPGAALDTHKSGCGELAAGSHRALFFPRHKGRTAVATQRVAGAVGHCWEATGRDVGQIVPSVVCLFVSSLTHVIIRRGAQAPVVKACR